MLAALRRCAAALATWSLAPAMAAVPQSLPATHLNEAVVRVPAGPALAVSLETTVYKPDGPGPFPLLVINHGKAAGDPKLQSRDRFVYMASAFVRRGYAVMVPMRTGFANSTGKYVEHGCNMAANGYTQANDVRDVIRYASGQDWVDARRIVVAGQSYGGLATMALATRAVPGVRGVMNFAGGLKMVGGNCDWQAALVRAFGEYGRRGKVASMWMYGANDQYFPPALAGRLHQAYTGAGGRAELVAFGPFQRDAHTMLASRDGEAVWLPAAARFLARIGMPFDERYTLADAGVQAPAQACCYHRGMCGRFDQHDIARRFVAAFGWADAAIRSTAMPTVNAAPGTYRPVMHMEDGQLVVDDLYWGYRARWAAEKLPVAYNARLEKITNNYWGRLFKTGRALVPADGWYEWTGEQGHRQPWHIHRKDREPVFMLALAHFGPFKQHKAESGFVLVTADASGGMVDIHDRRPVCLDAADAALWLDPDLPTGQAATLARSMALGPEAFEWYKVSPALNRAGTEGEELIVPLAQ